MELQIHRLWPVPGTTTGVLESDGTQLCFCLEDEVREISGLGVAEWKVSNQTAIPRGRYQIVMDMSTRFGRIMPHLLKVPGFTGIRIHGGNRASDTEGCVIVGEKRIDDQNIADCPPALDTVITLIEQAIANSEQVWITIS